MNFKKGSSITQKKLITENDKSLKIIKTLPSNMMSCEKIEMSIANYISSM